MAHPIQFLALYHIEAGVLIHFVGGVEVGQEDGVVAPAAAQPYSNKLHI